MNILSPIGISAELIVVSLIYVSISVILQRKLTNVDRMYEIRAMVNTKTKALMELSKRNDTQAMASLQKELSKLSQESLIQQMKPMVVVLGVFALLYYIMLPMLFSSIISTVTFLTFNVNYRTFFVAIAFVVGIISSFAISMYDRKRLKNKFNFGLMGPSLKEPQQQ
ncbi:MAG: hypothetical protein M1122_03395 [Candidatus Marsarchaeota archaeon]|jgi:uncharacterized membrane protein (DUF106 family)|nr:hypothetical protein [Candidatus Marsarchaeota archaeon]